MEACLKTKRLKALALLAIIIYTTIVKNDDSLISRALWVVGELFFSNDSRALNLANFTFSDPYFRPKKKKEKKKPRTSIPI